MKAKFLIPEIDKTKFAEELSKNMKIFELKLKSLTEVGVEDVSEVSISSKVTGFAVPEPNFPALFPEDFTTGSSTKLFQALQPGHCPIHLEDSYPHS